MARYRRAWTVVDMGSPGRESHEHEGGFCDEAGEAATLRADAGASTCACPHPGAWATFEAPEVAYPG